MLTDSPTNKLKKVLVNMLIESLVKIFGKSLVNILTTYSQVTCKYIAGITSENLGRVTGEHVRHATNEQIGQITGKYVG